MKKLLYTIIILTAFFVSGPLTPAWGTDYFACAAGEVHANNVWCTAAHANGSCSNDGTTEGDTAAILVAGNSFYANGCTMTIESGFTATKISTAANGEVAGGGFTLNSASYPNLTLTTAVEGGTTDCLTISGEMESGETITIIGNLTGSATTGSARAVYVTATVGGVTIGSGGSPTTITGGAGAYSSAGIYVNSATGIITVNGNCQAAKGMGCYYLCNSTGSFTVNGNCIGGTADPDGHGCFAIGSTGITVNGSIINGTRSAGAAGTIVWNPVAPASGVGSYFESDGNGTKVAVGKVTNEAAADVAAKIDSAEYFIKFDDHAITQGTKTAGGGGAWGF